MQATEKRAFWQALLNTLIAGSIAGALLTAMPVGAQVNIQKIGKDTGAKIKGGIEGDSTAQAAEAAAAETAAPSGTTPAEAPAADGTKPDPAGGLKPDNLDTYATPGVKPAVDMKAMLARVMEYMGYILDSRGDVRDRKFETRQPWISRAPRTNPFDPQIQKDLAFHDMLLPTTPPPPYYPPAGGIKLASLQDQFQKFLDNSRLTGIVTIKGTKFALIQFGKKTARLKIGDEVEEKDYVIRVKDIGKDTVVLETRDGDLQGLLALTAAANLFVGEGERALVIVSGSDEEKG